MNEFERFIQFLITSINNIDTQYYQTEFDGFYGFRRCLKNLGIFQGTRFIRHMERGFAYELNYQLCTEIEASGIVFEPCNVYVKLMAPIRIPVC